ncbi:hypothetical protein DdX_03292 [Ditylenchus destructor]|uniref:Uncharacterized protein n=1 Tax=Ditylenchus destructor TaxID=166010 RepID=A0AAD4R9W3_9BILA|nr:hypothetical protein DdX_03292 [Ditylenchus destructor]
MSNKFVATTVTVTAVALFITCGYIEAANFALADQIAQPHEGNFAYAKLFALADDGTTYRLIKRNVDGSLADRFAFKEAQQKTRFARHNDGDDKEFAFAFNKRSNSFAKRSAEPEWEQVSQAQVVPAFAKFAKRTKFA